MKKLLLICVLMVLCMGCIPLMHKTIAKQAVRVDKNCQTLLPPYREVLVERLADAKELPDGAEKTELLEEIAHDIALLEATLLLTGDMRKSAEMVLEK